MKSTEKLIKERIKALEEENKKLKERLFFIIGRNDEKQEIIDKAIEYIEKAIDTGNCPQDITYEDEIEKEHNFYINSKELLSILQGEDNEK